MLCAAAARCVRHRWMAAQFARDTRDGHCIRHSFILQHVLPPHIGGREDGNKRSWRGSLFHSGAASSFLALNQTHDSLDGESEFACRFNRLNCGSPGGANIIHNHYRCTLLAKALDTLPGTMLLFGFADQKTI